MVFEKFYDNISGMSTRLLVILFFLFVMISVEAQHSSLNGKFSVNDVKGCEGLLVTITHPLCTGSTSCAIVFGDGRPAEGFTTGQTFPYPTAGDFLLTIVVGSGVDNDAIE